MSLKQLKRNLAENIDQAITVLEQLEQKGGRFAGHALDEINEAAEDVNDKIHEYEKPVDNVLTRAVNNPHTVWLAIAALVASTAAGAFLHSLFC